MARLGRMPEPMKSHLLNLPCPTFQERPWVSGKPLEARRIAIISTAGLQRRGDRPFEAMTGEYRVIPGDITAGELVMTHISTNFDRTGFQQDWNVAFPLDRLKELAAEGSIGSREFNRWFWQDTAAGRILKPVKERCMKESDESLKKTGAMLLVPLDQT